MILGIDLGTTNSLCGVFDEGRPRLIENVHGDFLTPSVVGVLPGDEVVVGAVAKELAVTRPERAVACFKRWMGGAEKAMLAGREFSAPELSSLVLRSLRDDAVKRLGYEVDEAVITVPAYFNDHQRKATKSAGELAGLKVRRIVNEPTAAALAYGFHESASEKTLLVIDLGGGTFDVTLMEVFEKTLEILSTAGESCLGGEDFTDRLLAETLRLSAGPSLEVAELREPLRVARLRQECELAKRRLGDTAEATVRLPEADGTFAAGGPTTELSAERFASIAEPLLERLAGPIDRVLRDAQVGPDAIDDVILVGGATRMPILRDFVARRLGKPPIARFDPDQVVCLGATVQAALIADDSAVEEMVMTDVCPFTLGVDTSKQFGGEIRSGYYTPILHRNTTIPVSKEHPFATVYPNQREVQVDVYQGEHRRVEKNLKLGELTVTGVPPGPPGQTVYIRFTYDLNGILEVEAYAEGSSEKARAVFTQHAGELSGVELKAAIERLQSFKYYPREDQESQRLLRAAERVVGEISPFQRDQLEMAIDSLEAALGEGEREIVESSKAHLAQTLSSLGYDDRGRRHD